MRPRGRRIEAGGEGGGDAGEPVVVERAVDRAAVAVDDVESGAVIAPAGSQCRWSRRSGPTATQPGSSRKASAKMRAAASYSLGSRGRISTRRDLLLTDACAARAGRLRRTVGDRTGSRPRAPTSAIPFGHSPHYDLIADLDGGCSRVQVKTSRVPYKGRWAVTVCTRGGNQSWSGLVKTLDPSELRLPVRPGRRRPPVVHPGRLASRAARASTLGGPKYARVRGRARRSDPGRTRRRDRLYNRRSCIARGDVRVAKGDGL